MNYTGTIVGFQSSFASIYKSIDFDNKCTSWSAAVTAVSIEKKLQIKFLWYNEQFDLVLYELKDNYYSGKLLLEGEKYGNAYLWQYRKNDEILLKGDYVEDELGNFECFIELKPLI